VEVIWQVRLCEVVSVSCNATMDAHSYRHQGSHRGYTCAALYEAAVFQIILPSRAATGSARRRRLLMQGLVLVRWTLIDTTLLCSGSSKSPRIHVLIPASAE
jgi:hypothetical protein